MCLLYEVDAETTERLVEMARGTKAEEWWESQDAKAPRWFGMYLSLEEVAERIQVFEPTLIHGLFQTPDYTRVLARTTEPDLVEVETLLATRRMRQEKILGRNPPLRIDLVLGEPALRVSCADPSLMTAQIEHLHAIAARPEIDVRIVPLARGLHLGAYGKFTLLDFPEQRDPSVVYLEMYEAARYPERPDQVERFRRRFQSVRAAAVPLEEFGL